ncbi:hypothetical protein VB711_03480 [Cronbergia sp. UHCC 0137]|nr:hypothetical protein [Cronbergia sp. UHCC 0137]MEA5616905.1 hypothetical protein [Cronbergia sp. UHCC 0137]
MRNSVPEGDRCWLIVEGVRSLFVNGGEVRSLLVNGERSAIAVC